MRKPSRLRNRLYGRVPPHRLDAVVHRSLLVLGAMAWLAAAPVLANLLGINWWRALLLPLWVAFLLPSTLLLLEATSASAPRPAFCARPSFCRRFPCGSLAKWGTRPPSLA